MKKIILASLVGLSVFTTACEDNREEFLSDYSTIMYIRNSGSLEETCYVTGENSIYEIPVVKAGYDDKAVAAAKLSVMDEAQLLAYNAENGTDYVMLPTSCYVFDGANFVFAPEDMYKVAVVEFIPTAIRALDAKNYVLPLALTSPKEVNPEKSMVFIAPKAVTPTVYFEETGFVDMGDVTEGSGTQVFEVPVVLPLENSWNFSFTVNVSQEVLDEYNAANGKKLVLTDESAYKIEKTDFTPGSNEALVTLSVDKSKLNWGVQAVPLKLEACSNEYFEVDQEKNTFIVGINRTVKREELKDVTSTFAADLGRVTGYGWATGDGTEKTASYDGQGAAGLFDGSAGFWHGDWSKGLRDAKYGQYIDFALAEEANHFSYDFWTRSSNSNGAPKVTIIYVKKEEGDDWTELKEIGNSLSGGYTKYSAGVMSSPEPFNFVRFSVTQSNAGNVLTGSYWNCGEMKLYTK